MDESRDRQCSRYLVGTHATRSFLNKSVSLASAQEFITLHHRLYNGRSLLSLVSEVFGVPRFWKIIPDKGLWVSSSRSA